MIAAATRALLPKHMHVYTRTQSQQRKWRVRGGSGLVLLVAGGVGTTTTVLCSSSSESTTALSDNTTSPTPTCRWNNIVNNNNMNIPIPFLFQTQYCECEAAAVDDSNVDTEEEIANNPVMTDEEEYFLDKLALYRRWLKEIQLQWAVSSPASIKWPRNIPQEVEVSALETDLQNYLKGGQGHTRKCQDVEFRIASYYLFREDSVEQQRKGFQIVKKLAVDGHQDGLCLYAMVWNHGGVAGIEAKPHLAVKYWRQAADAGHLASMYELAVALYMGDGAVENPSEAVQYFIKAADLGHSGAAYLLADCYLDGVGVERSRGKALEWLMTAAEMGHRQAQRRAEALLTGGSSSSSTEEEQGEGSSSTSSSSTSSSSSPLPDTSTSEFDNTEECIRWGRIRDSDWYCKVSLERRFTIGGGSRNPTILCKRKTAVAESRKSEN